MHSGIIKTSGDVSTVWYNYTLATVGTIIDEDTTQSNPATNIAKATESICPNGWTLPTKDQINTQRNVSAFLPVLGGYYYNGTLYVEDTRGRWWGSEAQSGRDRYSVFYSEGNLATGSYYRNGGVPIRCVQKS